MIRGWLQRCEGEPPTCWALATYWLITFVVVTAYLPMAWDRYMLSIQAPTTLLAAGVLVAAFDGLWRIARPSPEGA